MEVKLTEEDKIKALCGGICKYEKYIAFLQQRQCDFFK